MPPVLSLLMPLRPFARNDPCYAHMLHSIFAMAVASHQAGQLDAAAELYRQILTYEKRQFDAMHMLAVVTGQPAPVMHGYIAELEADHGLASAIVGAARKIPRHLSDADETAKYGRRLGWYVLARWLKPRIVVETGVDKGLGSVVLCSALKRNTEEGRPGRYFGTDINPDAGALLVSPYRSFGRILVGDSLASLSTLAESVDLFINDSDHSAEYERLEYEAIGPKLSPRAIILGDNAHVTTELADFSHRQGRSFLFFHEEPLEHWYPGAGIGISFKAAA